MVTPIGHRWLIACRSLNSLKPTKLHPYGQLVIETVQDQRLRGEKDWPCGYLSGGRPGTR